MLASSYLLNINWLECSAAVAVVAMCVSMEGISLQLRVTQQQRRVSEERTGSKTRPCAQPIGTRGSLIACAVQFLARAEWVEARMADSVRIHKEERLTPSACERRSLCSNCFLRLVCGEKRLRSQGAPRMLKIGRCCVIIKMESGSLVWRGCRTSCLRLRAEQPLHAHIHENWKTIWRAFVGIVVLVTFRVGG